MQNSPYPVDVKAGETKYFCACGQSKNAPFCDGSHQGTGKTPIAESFSEDKTVYICGCGKSGGAPYCDGTHQKG